MADDIDRLVGSLAATTVGVYVLLVVGASTAVLDGAAACSTWPACGGQWLLSPGDPLSLVAAWLHRALALVVWIAILATIAVAWRRTARTSRRVRTALTVAVAMYPIQVGVGALTATSGGYTVLSVVHLVLAMAIFSALVLALLWQLEAATSPKETRPNPRADPAPVTPGSRREQGVLASYLELTKPKLWWLLCLVALAAMGLAGGRTLDSETVLATLAGGVLAVAASGTFNNVLERDVDRRMVRTGDRPLVDGRIPVRNAVAFGIVLAVASIAVFVTFVNVLAAALGLLAVLFYSVGYTVVLKPNTSRNIVLGGAVGAFPALIGWAAVTETVGVPAVILGAVIFLWTPAHFYNLALAYRDDYARAGFPMLPVVRGDQVTRRHILLYLGATMLAAILLGADAELDVVYAATVAVVGGVFVWTVVRLFHERDERAAFRAFHASNAYLGCLLLAVVADTILV